MPKSALPLYRVDGSKLKSLRLKKKWDQRALAAHTGVSAATICRLETGSRPIKKKFTLDMIAKKLGCHLEDLLVKEGRVRRNGGGAEGVRA